MRQRYYNPEIKRFINQDIIIGSIGSSQSLNRYCYVQGNPVSMTDPFGLFPIISCGDGLLHGILNIAGLIPGQIGLGADLLNAGIYAIEGDGAGAVSSLISATPFLGEIAGAKLMVRGGRWVKTGQLVKWTFNLIGNGATFLRGGFEFLNGISGLIDEYEETGTVSAGSVGAVLLNGAAAFISGRNTIKSGNALRKLVSEANVTSKFKKSLGNVTGKVKSSAGNEISNAGSEISKSGRYARPNKIANLLDGRPELTGSTRDKLLATVQDQELSKIVDELYRPGATVGDGGTAAILVEEYSKGSSKHLLKATERLTQLEKLAGSGKLGLNDLDVVEALMDDLESAINLYN